MTEYPNIRKGFTHIYVNRDISFIHPFSRPNDYKSVAQQILNNKSVKMSLPNGEKTSYLLHAVYCGPQEFQEQPEAAELRDEIMKPRYLWLFQRNLWIPENIKTNYGPGVFVVYDEEGVGTSEELDIGELEKALKSGKVLKNGIRFSEDGKIGFAPRNTYKNGEFETAKEFAKDGFIIASNKEQGARNLAEVSQSKYFKIKKPFSWIVDPSEEPVRTVSALGGWGGLVFVGFHDGSRIGFASGVSSSAEGTRKNF